MPKPWYEAAFGADYLERYRHRDLEEAARAVASLLCGVLPQSGASVLDLCCGAGRHVAVMSRAGHRVVGFDLSADLLDAAVELVRGRDCAAPACFVRGDKRALPFRGGAFDVVTHFFTAFGYFESDAENFAVFAEVSRVLRPAGWYLFDFLSAPRIRAELADSASCSETEDFPDGTVVETRKRLSGDGRRAVKELRFVREGVTCRTLRESVGLFEPAELRAALAAARLPVANEWGAYDAAPYRGAESERWIALCRRE